MKSRPTAHLAALLVLGWGAVSPAIAANVTAQHCLSVQLRLSAVACRGVAKCYTKAMRSGKPLSTPCIGLIQERLVSDAAEIEAAANCLVKGEARSVGDMMVVTIDEVGGGLTLTGGSCAGSKMAALGKACHGFFRCNATADANSTTLDPDCIATSAAKAAKSFTKLEARGNCATTGDLAAHEGKMAAMVDAVHVVLRGTGTTTTSSTNTTR